MYVQPAVLFTSVSNINFQARAPLHLTNALAEEY